MTETRDDTFTWLTQEAYDRLKAELDYLSGPGRIEIAKKIESAREEGDLKENGGYHAAKDEQGMQEARIRQLTQILENSRVGEAPHTGFVRSRQGREQPQDEHGHRLADRDLDLRNAIADGELANQLAKRHDER